MDEQYRNDSLPKGFSGRALAQKFFNRTFTTKLGSISFDHVGERIPIINVNQLEWHENTIRVSHDAQCSNSQTHNRRFTTHQFGYYDHVCFNNI